MKGGVVIICGGTGGHLAPGIGTAQQLADLGIPVELVVSDREVDSRLMVVYPNLPYKRAVGAPFRWNPVGLVRFLWCGLRSSVQAFRHLRATRPSVLLAFGGYLSVSWVLAARFLEIPVVLHEANRKAGRSISSLARFAERIYLPEGVKLGHVEPQRLRRLGMPLRKEVRHRAKEEIRRKLGIASHAKVLVVVGGSQGALALNEWVERYRRSLAGDGIQVMLVSGPGKVRLPESEELESDIGERLPFRNFEFHDALHELLSSADVVVSRAGAGTVAELVECLAPSILVPYPHASDNHQLWNARDLERRGGCVLLEQVNLDQLYREVLDIIFNDWLLGRMRQNLRLMRHRNASEQLARDLWKEYIRPPAHSPQVMTRKTAKGIS